MERVIIKKNGRERIEVSVQTYGGKPFLDIRAYYYDAEANDWKPTKKGITIPAPLVKAVSRGVRKVGEPFFELAVDEDATGIERKAKKKKRDPEVEAKAQRKLQKAMAAALLEEATALASGKKKKKRPVDDDVEELIEKSAKAGVDIAMKRIKSKDKETNVTTIKKKKKKDAVEDDGKEAWESVKKRLKSASEDLKKHIKEISKPIGPDGLTADERKKKKLKKSEGAAKVHKRPRV